MRILNYNSSFLLVADSFSFIIFKRLYHTSFKLDIHFSRALYLWSPTEPTEWLTENPGPQLCFISQFMENADLFSILVNALSSLIHLHGFQLLVLLPSLIAVTSPVYTNKINLPHLNWSSDRLVIVVKGFVKLIEQKNLSLPKNLAFATFGESLIVFSTKVNLLYFLYLTDLRCCLLILIKQNHFTKNLS